jgi:hypothetical protein
MKLLEKASNIAVIIAACTISVVAVRTHLVPAVPTKDRTSFLARYKDKTVPLDGYGGGSPTIVIFASKTCHFCAESLPFYPQLAKIRDASGGEMKLIVAFPSSPSQSADEMRDYFQSRGLTPDQLIGARFSEIGVSGTPTIALVTSSGSVESAWVGKLEASKEAEVVGRLKALCGRCRIDG